MRNALSAPRFCGVLFVMVLYLGLGSALAATTGKPGRTRSRTRSR